MLIVMLIALLEIPFCTVISRDSMFGCMHLLQNLSPAFRTISNAKLLVLSQHLPVL